MPEYVMHRDFHVHALAEHVAEARRKTAKVLADWGISGDVADTARLIVSELVTNVVRHAAALSPTVAITLALDEHTVLVVGVADAHPFHPHPLPLPHAGGGRGLLLVDALAREVGGRIDVLPVPASGGKQIVVRLPLAPVPT